MKVNANKQAKAAPNSFIRAVQLILIVFAVNSALGQNVGIGIDNPAYKLEVNGSAKATNFFTNGSLGLGTLLPSYRFHLVDGAIGITNTTDNQTWVLSYSSNNNGLNFSNNTITRLTILNNGNIGLTNTAPAYRLDVNGSIHADANAIIDGNVTVNNGKGIIQNVQGAAQLKYYTRTATFSIALPGFGSIGDVAIGFASAGFTNPPKVFVGDIVSTGGTVGELYRIQLVIYAVTPTQCLAKLINTSPNSVNYSTTWNIICIGD